MTALASPPVAAHADEQQVVPRHLFEPLVPTPAWKRIFDILASATAIVVLSPLLVLIATAVAVDSRGGPIFRQTRVGRGGASFTCWKFRSMYRGADLVHHTLSAQNEAQGLIFKMKEDPRRTRVGKVLRKTSLDELPQLWNVLRGEMSLVGPRPPLVTEVLAYHDEEFRRLAVKPGITGLWQVTLRGRHNFADMVHLDRKYADELSPWLDLRILLKTVPTVLFGRGSY
jgi:lipopolysaccharide/colanic/teichoic acid biosynthesis glycosyltransferase